MYTPNNTIQIFLTHDGIDYPFTIEAVSKNHPYGVSYAYGEFSGIDSTDSVLLQSSSLDQYPTEFAVDMQVTYDGPTSEQGVMIQVDAFGNSSGDPELIEKKELDQLSGVEPLLVSRIFSSDVSGNAANKPNVVYKVTITVGNSSETVFMSTRLYSVGFIPRSRVTLGKTDERQVVELFPPSEEYSGSYKVYTLDSIVDYADTPGAMYNYHNNRKVLIKLSGNDMITGVPSVNDSPGFCCDAEYLGGSSVKPKLGSVPLNPDIMNGKVSATSGSQIIFEKMCGNAIEYITTANGIVFVLSSSNIDDPEFTSIDFVAWSESKVNSWNELDRWQKYQTLNPAIYDGFTDEFDADGYKYYGTYYRIYYDYPFSYASGYALPIPITFNSNFPLCSWYHYPGSVQIRYEQDSVVIQWGRNGSRVITTNDTISSGTKHTLPYIFYPARELGYILQFDSVSGLNTVSPVTRGKDSSTADSLSPKDIRLYKTNNTFLYWDLPPGGALNASDSSSSYKLWPGNSVRVLENCIATPTFKESSPCVNTLYVGLWKNKAELDIPNPSVGDTISLYVYDPNTNQPIVNTFYENSQTDDTITPPLAYPMDAAHINAHIRVLDTTSNRVKVGVWVKVEPWIYDGYWKPAPSAIQLNENLSENNGWSKSIS